MISYKEALDLVIDKSKKHKLAIEKINSMEAVGYIVAKDIFATISIQPFDNSAMDGFALKYDDIKKLENGGEVILNKKDIIAAGDFFEKEGLHSGDCYHIMTGAIMPKTADTVVPIELVTIDGDRIKFTKPAVYNSHIRRAGEDFKSGDIVLKKGAIVKPAHIMVFAALGISEIDIYKKPQAVFISTGAELLDDLSKDLKNGQIYNSNKYYAVETLKNMGANCIDAITVHDDVEKFRDILKKYIDSNIDIIISSGAVSAGEFDFIRFELESIGAEIIFHKVSMKPGKPNLFAILPNGTLYFGLPGNPVATAVGLRFFIYPAIRSMQARQAEKTSYAKTNNKFSNKRNLQLFLKAKSRLDSKGEITIDILDGQASFKVSPFLEMDSWAIVPDNLDMIDCDDMIEFYPL